MVSYTTTHIKIQSLPLSATKSNGLKHLAYGSLFSVRQACNNNRSDVFDKKTVNIFKSTEVSINTLCPPVTQGHRNAPPQLIYSVSIPAHPP